MFVDDKFFSYNRYLNNPYIFFDEIYFARCRISLVF
jgi:hypothetical protein